MAKAELLCPMEIGGVEHKAGDVVEIDDASMKVHLRRNAVKPVTPKKKKKKTEPASEK